MFSENPSLQADDDEAFDGKGAVGAMLKLLHEHHVLEEGTAFFDGLEPVDIVNIEAKLLFGVKAFMHLHSPPLNPKPVVLFKQLLQSGMYFLFAIREAIIFLHVKRLLILLEYF